MVIFLLIAVLVPVVVLLALAFVSTLGLEVDQTQVKRSSRWTGLIVVAYGLGAGHWFPILAGSILLLISHPKINLPGIARRIDKSISGSTDNPGQHVP